MHLLDVEQQKQQLVTDTAEAAASPFVTTPTPETVATEAPQQNMSLPSSILKLCF
jgi:hypothetical protein